jgi:proteasome lid subunit RPN8/RPN11
MIPKNVIDNTVSAVRSFGTRRVAHEGIVYWAGAIVDARRVVVTTCVIPSAHTTEGSYQTSALANAEVISLVNRHHIQLIGQTHSHPGIWVDHSLGDVRGAFMPYEGFLSIVVGRYAKHGMLPLNELCGIHIYHSGIFVRLTETQVQRNFFVIPSLADLR